MSRVELYVYEMSNWLLSAITVEELLHTSIVTHGKEISYNFYNGIEVAAYPQKPIRKVFLGHTDLSWSQVEAYINSLASHKYTIQSYRTMNNNCNNFSNTVSLFLCDREIPQEILTLPERVLGQGVAAVALAAVTLAAATAGRCNIV